MGLGVKLEYQLQVELVLNREDHEKGMELFITDKLIKAYQECHHRCDSCGEGLCCRTGARTCRTWRRECQQADIWEGTGKSLKMWNWQ